MQKSIELNPSDFQNHIISYLKKEKNTILRHALSKTSIEDIVYSKDNFSKTNFAFSHTIKTLPVTNQKKSGRCWIFAALNVLREIIAKKLNLKEFELSQSYISLFDKLEKINYELEAIIDLIDKDYDDRTLCHILQNTISDGGQWDMFVSLVKKYGIVPKNVFDESFTSSDTAHMTKLIKVNLRKFASFAHEMYEKEKNLDKIREEKNKLLEKIYDLMLDLYGIPPNNFDFEYLDKDDNYHIEQNYTPKTFFEKYIGNEIDEYISLIHAPTKSKKYMTSYTIQYLGNVVGGKTVKHLNLPMERIITLILSQLKDNEIVWFGADVSFYRNRTQGHWDDQNYDYETPFGLSFDYDKGECLDYGISAMNHAMCITGVDLKNDVPLKWKIENSWGSEKGYKGYYFMSDSWFRKYTYQAVVKRKYLTQDEQNSYDQDPVVLKPWDPMGSLAYLE